jgi:para-nitrobenzyl esterase
VSSIDQLIAVSDHGKVRGQRENGIQVFKGIPFGASTGGQLRWSTPRPAAAWKTARAALEFGPVAPQSAGGMSFMQEAQSESRQSENCLNLNIWTPALDNARRPVMFWIHGGAFNRGSGSMPGYDGTSLVKRGDVVVVSINYRLGPLGFLHLANTTGGKIKASGNEGLLDQVLALAWVRDNILAFGGDPENVTVFGESAGAMSIGCLLSMPCVRGLFHKAIMQSGSNTVKFLDEAVELSRELISILGLAPDQPAQLKKTAARQLVAAHASLAASLKIRGSVLEPVVDGDVLPYMPIEAVRQGSARGVPILVGTNLEEAKFMAKLDPGMARIDEAGLVRRWQAVLPVEVVPKLVERCRRAMLDEGRDASVGELAIALQTDRQFRMPALRLLEGQNGQGKAFHYIFTWKSPMAEMGACHALEVGFVFGNLNSRFHGEGKVVEGLSHKMQDAWIAFARSGDPSCPSLGTWPEYGPARKTMLLGAKCEIAAAPFEQERLAWSAVPDRYLG